MKNLTLSILADEYAISRMDPGAAIPPWADGDGFVSISRTRDELSIVCRQDRCPTDGQIDRGWRCLRLEGPFAFDEVGIVAAVVIPLADAGAGIFVVSTFDGDHVLLKAGQLEDGVEALRRVGHRVLGAPHGEQSGR